MPFPAVRFHPGSGGSAPLPAHLAIASAGDLGQLRVAEAPAAYVVRRDDLVTLRGFADVVIDRRRKHPAKGLAALLLGHEKIPLIEGSYKDPGQLIRSIRTLLRNAVDRGEANLYVIGVDAELFERLQRRAKVDGRSAAAAGAVASGAGAAGAAASGAAASGTGGAGRPSAIHVAAVTPAVPWGTGGDRAGSAEGAGPEAAGGIAAASPLPLLSLLPPREVPAELSHRFVGRSPEAHLVRQLILVAAELDDPALVLGSTGTGKEVVARAIHDYSDRRTQAFVPVNCGAIPQELVESELFGHLPGSFTGAVRRKDGLWKAAHRGTIFLDEIGDLPLLQQVKILRAIEQGTIRPLGAEAEIKVDARVIAATNRDLFGMVQAGEFREDLYYRLRAFMVRTPALQEHPEDVPVLAQFFWRAITKESKATLPREISDALRGYRWPGNARELRAVLAHLHALFGRHRLEPRHLRAVFALEGQTVAPARPAEREIDLHRVECLRHLRRADEVIRAVEVTTSAGFGEPVDGRAGAVAAGRGTPPAGGLGAGGGEIARHRSELELLCHRSLLFHGEAAYAAVSRLRDVVAHLAEHGDGDPKPAAAYWRTEGGPALQAARAEVLRAVEKLVRRH
jgi:hypothetical protein